MLTGPLYLKEVAAAHIAALFTPEASNQRFLICAGQIPSQKIADIWRANFPELADRVPEGISGAKTLPDDAYNASSEKAGRVLGIKNRSLEESLVDLGKQLLAIEKEEKEGSS
jgi:NADPH-dependent methylglyoxal reductase